MSEIRALVVTLAECGVEFVICGGVACILHGISRVTNDVDICVRMADDNLCKLIEAARRLNLSPRIPEPLEALLDQAKRRQWIEEKHAWVFSLFSRQSPLQLDIFLKYPIAFDDLADSADPMETDNVTILVSSKQHLIDAKRQVQPPRKVDLRDIEDLEELIGNENNVERED